MKLGFVSAILPDWPLEDLGVTTITAGIAAFGRFCL